MRRRLSPVAPRRQWRPGSAGRHTGSGAIRTAAVAAALLALAGCGKGGAAEQTPPAETAARAAPATGDDAPYYTKLPLSEFMPHVMQYAGDGIWKRQGYIMDKTGEHSLFPKNDEEWEAAESGARTLAEVTNVLLIPGRRVPDPEWDKAVEGVRRVALKAADAAEKHDKDGIFAAGGELDEACDACHVRFDPKFKPQNNVAPAPPAGTGRTNVSLGTKF